MLMIDILRKNIDEIRNERIFNIKFQTLRVSFDPAGMFDDVCGLHTGSDAGSQSSCR